MVRGAVVFNRDHRAIWIGARPYRNIREGSIAEVTGTCGPNYTHVAMSLENAQRGTFCACVPNMVLSTLD